MHKIKQNESGFSAIEVVLIIIIISILGVVGWWVYKTNKNTNKTLTDTSEGAGEAQKSTTKTTTNATKPTTTYLTIKEWGVRFTYSNDTLTYNAPESNAVTVISKNLADKYACTKRGGGLIVRHGATDAVDGSSDNVEQYAAKNPNTYIHVGNYYYNYIHDQAWCSDTKDPGTTGVQDSNDTYNTIKAEFAKLEAIPTN